MKFRAIACPPVSKGVKLTDGMKRVVPNQAMSLAEIIQRFSRGEPVNVGDRNPPVFNEEGDDDLEKVAKADLVDRAEFSEKMSAVQDKYKMQERKKAAAEKARLEQLAIDKLAEQKKAAEQQPPAK